MKAALAASAGFFFAYIGNLAVPNPRDDGINADNFSYISEGMTLAEVTNVLGREPSTPMPYFDPCGSTIYHWRGATSSVTVRIDRYNGAYEMTYSDNSSALQNDEE